MKTKVTIVVLSLAAIGISATYIVHKTMKLLAEEGEVIQVIEEGDFPRNFVPPSEADMRRDFDRYSGARGPSITAFDDRTDQWLAELQEESTEETLAKLTDAAEHLASRLLNQGGTGGGSGIYYEWQREENYYCHDIPTLLGNRRFRKAYEDLLNTDRETSVELLVNNIMENLDVLRSFFQEDVDKVSRGDYSYAPQTIAYIPANPYRPMSNPNRPPTRYGRRYAVLSYVFLASLLELYEVRPVIEEVIQFAREEYELVQYNGEEVWSEEDQLKHHIFDYVLYNPSFLLTATLCDPSWNVEQKEALAEKFVAYKVVDYQSRAIEHDKEAREGWIPVVAHKGDLEIRHYKGITDAEFNAFFGE